MLANIRQHWLFYMAGLMLWAKTYLVQRFSFDLSIDSWYQEIVLLISPISSVLLLLGLGLLVSKKKKNLSILIVSFVTSFILWANLIFYRFFHDFITLPVLFQTSNAGDLGSSILRNLHWTDPLIFADVIILLFLIAVKKCSEVQMERKELINVFTMAIVIFFINWGMAEVARPELFARTFDRQIIVKSVGTYNYHIYDAIVNSVMQTKKVFAKSDDIMDAEKFIRRSIANKNAEMYAVSKGKNVIVISLESVQSFVINRTLKQQEITPFLNQLIKESYYFENFYHQTGQGKTSDSEFLLENALYPLPSGAVFFTHAHNTYYATPKILKEHGYHSAVFHANEATFWNRDTMYQSLGYDQFFSLEYFNTNDESKLVGWGLKDIEFFKQSMFYLRQLPQPFYVKFITLTNHHPFLLHPEDQLIPEFDSNDGTVNRYFTTVRYTDEALKRFFEDVKKYGLYEDSIFIIYGDHYGISQNHYEALGEFLGREITPFDHVQLQKVPLIIHIPGHEPQKLDTVGGQIDIRPTLMNLLGIEPDITLDFGQDLFSPNRDSFVVMRDGSFVTDQYVYTNDVCYNKETRQAVEETECAEWKERAIQELEYSDEIIYGDLLRFLEE